jgi:hypothetical protein
MVTLSPLACNNLASEAETIPFPNDEVTPPVTNTYLDISLVLVLKKLCAPQHIIIQHLLRRTLQRSVILLSNKFSRIQSASI